MFPPLNYNPLNSAFSLYSRGAKRPHSESPPYIPEKRRALDPSEILNKSISAICEDRLHHIPLKTLKDLKKTASIAVNIDDFSEGTPIPPSTLAKILQEINRVLPHLISFKFSFPDGLPTDIASSNLLQFECLSELNFLADPVLDSTPGFPLFYALKHLESISYEQIESSEHPNVLISPLKDFECLKHLSLRICDLDDKDFKALGDLKDLETLELCYFTGISLDSFLSSLSKIASHLNSLAIRVKCFDTTQPDPAEKSITKLCKEYSIKLEIL
jgi:hypothetical protein